MGTPPPVDPDAFRSAQRGREASAVLSLEPVSGGMRAHWLARRVTRRGGTGPWSAAAGATVAA